MIEAFWDGPIFLTGTLDSVTNPTTYTPPASYVAPYDPTHDSGMVKDAFHAMEDVFDRALGYIVDNRGLSGHPASTRRRSSASTGQDRERGPYRAQRHPDPRLPAEVR